MSTQRDAAGRAVPEVSGSFEDEAPFARFPWLTQRHLTFFVIGWLIIFSLGSVLISNPFQAETSAGAAPDYWHVMYLHGLLIGMVGLLALLTCSILCLRSRHTRAWIVGGVLFATIVTAIGGIWDNQIPGAEIPMWTQILGFFALDEILIVMLFAMYQEWGAGVPVSRSLPFAVAGLGAASMLAAAVMGHLAGWILEFGNNPPLIGDWASYVGASVDDFSGALIGSHSHDMAVAVMALTLAIAARQFGFDRLTGSARGLGRLGLGMVGLGVVIMSILYVWMGFWATEPPAMLTSADGVNGIASDDVVTGILVMGGGVLTLLAFALSVRDREINLFGHATRVAAVWSWVLSFATVVVAGYAIELNETTFGAGEEASGAANDAVYTWLHQDIGLFLLPALVLIMLIVERLVAQRYQRPIAWAVIAGSTVTFVGGMVFVFVDPTLHGSGYILATTGLLVVGAALLGTMWWGALQALFKPPPMAAPRTPAARAV